MSTKLKSKITHLLSKYETSYNTRVPLHTSKYYHDTVTMYHNIDHLYVSNDRKKIVDTEYELYTNPNCYHSLKIGVPTININDNVVTCEYVVHFYESLKPEIHQLLQKLTIKDVNMDKLIDDLNDNGINVDALLCELQKHGKDLKPILTYLSKQKIEISNLMVILLRNNVTIPNLLQNPYVYDLLKQSDTYAWVIGNHTKPKDVSFYNIKDKKLIKKIHVYTIFKIKNDDISIVNINYNKMK